MGGTCLVHSWPASQGLQGTCKQVSTGSAAQVGLCCWPGFLVPCTTASYWGVQGSRELGMVRAQHLEQKLLLLHVRMFVWWCLQTFSESEPHRAPGFKKTCIHGETNILTSPCCWMYQGQWLERPWTSYSFSKSGSKRRRCKGHLVLSMALCMQNLHGEGWKQNDCMADTEGTTIMRCATWNEIGFQTSTQLK